MAMSYRPANWETDSGAILEAVERLRVESPHYGYSQFPSVEKTVDYIKYHIKNSDAFIVDEAYLLLVGEGEAWHGHDEVLEERLVLRLHGGRLALVPGVLEDIARGRGVDAIMAHDSSIGFRMGAIYQRAGMHPITTTYFKEL